jgi:predicted acylesterase/phospholipase RssA
MTATMKNCSFILASLVAVLLLLAGPAWSKDPVNDAANLNAHFQAMPEIRAVVGIPNSKIQESLLRSINEEAPNAYPADAQGRKIYPILCISGGSANGAYGAGLLKGWSLEGSRPDFKVVTGISTGAITAPMAFLGKEYDSTLEEMYTTISTKDVIKKRSGLAQLTGNSMVNSRPLEQHLEKYYDDTILGKIALAHMQGRRLYVGTTLLDFQRLVLWDLGAIAASGDAKLFRKVILASASVPVIFPPVTIEVKSGDTTLKEMHVDGGTVTQIFTTYKVLENSQDVADKMGIDLKKIKSKVYIIRNGYVAPQYKEVKDNLPSIAGMAMDTMINSQGIGDTYRIYTFMQKMGNDFNLAYIPSDFRPEGKEAFDPAQMKQLFDRGLQDAVKGYKWHKVPSGLESENF